MLHVEDVLLGPNGGRPRNGNIRRLSYIILMERSERAGEMSDRVNMGDFGEVFNSGSQLKNRSQNKDMRYNLTFHALSRREHAPDNPVARFASIVTRRRQRGPRVSRPLPA